MRALFGGAQSIVNMEFALPAVIIKAIGGVRVLLCLNDDCSAADGMDRARVHVDHVAFIYVNPVQQMFQAGFTYRQLDFALACSRLQSQPDLRSRLGPQHIPTLCLTAGLANSG